MSTYWQLNTKKDPLGALQTFLQKLWPNAEIDGILIPCRMPENGAVKPYLLDAPEQLAYADPFAPVMLKNMAVLVAELTQEYPHNRFAAVLRPCELRALIEMHKHNAVDLERVFLIGMECLGTFPAEDYNWRAERKDGAKNLTNEILMFSRLGGIVESRYRTACQMCDNPSPHAGDLHIAFLGIAANDSLLVSTENGRMDDGLQLGKITDGSADADTINQNHHMLNKIEGARQKVRGRVTAALKDNFPRDIKSLIQWMENCGECQECLAECPICSFIEPEKNAQGHYEPWSIISWLVSCADCGMCEQACPKNLPLSAIFGNIRRELSRAYGYTPGHSITDPLPT
jgi:formate dehydrogenase subunit beta